MGTTGVEPVLYRLKAGCITVLPNAHEVGVTGFVRRRRFRKGTCNHQIPKLLRYQVALHPVYAPGGTRTLTKKQILSLPPHSNWATGANWMVLVGFEPTTYHFWDGRLVPIGLQDRKFTNCLVRSRTWNASFKERCVTNYTTRQWNKWLPW